MLKKVGSKASTLNYCSQLPHNSALGSIEVTIRNAIEAPYFVFGKLEYIVSILFLQPRMSLFEIYRGDKRLRLGEPHLPPSGPVG